MMKKITLRVNDSLILSSKNEILVIEEGSVDLFCVDKNDKSSFFICGFKKGETIFNHGFSSVPLVTEIRAVRDTIIRVYSLRKYSSSDLDSWVKKLSSMFSKTEIQTKVSFMESESFLKQNESIEISLNLELRRKEELYWIQLKKGQIDVNKFSIKEIFPLIEHCLLWAKKDSRLKLVPTSKLSHHLLKIGLRTFHEAFIQEILNANSEKKEFLQKQKEEDIALEETLSKETTSILASAIHLSEEKIFIPTISALIKVCSLVGEKVNIKFKEITLPQSLNAQEQVQLITERSNIHFKKVRLDEVFWKEDIGPMLAFYSKENIPVALLPKNSRHMWMIFADGKKTLVDEKVAKDIQLWGYFFYKNFPDNPTLWEVLRFATFNSRKDFFDAFLAGILSAFASLFLPFAIGWIFGIALPIGDKKFVVQICLGIIAMAFGNALFSVTQIFSVLRLQSKMGYQLQGSIMGRLLNLNLAFFRKNTAADLYKRVSAIDDIRQQLNSALFYYAITGILSVLYLTVMMYNSLFLSFMAILPIIVGISLYVVGFFAISKRNLIAQNAQGKIFSFLVQAINGIAKVRVAGAESKIYGQWAQLFSMQKKTELSSFRIQVLLLLIKSIFTTLATITLFLFILDAKNKMPIGAFLSFFTAFGAFLTSGFAFATNIVTVSATCSALWKRSENVRLEEVETNTQKAAPGVLTGRVGVEQLSFGYLPHSQILKNISMEIMPGEFAAIVGYSGCGKSTLIRLLLGMEKATRGKIYYDGKDLEAMDVVQVRKQVGTILQTGSLLGGSLRDNIVCGRYFSTEEIENALKMCGFENTLKNLPMGLETIIPMGGGTLSGGQRQQLMIARALIGRPKILILDEATSALDNLSQETITKSIEDLNITRIIVAHRLSTIINADTIYVLDKGTIAAKGTFKELIRSSEFFYRFAEKQLSTSELLK